MRNFFKNFIHNRFCIAFILVALLSICISLSGYAFGGSVNSSNTQVNYFGGETTQDGLIVSKTISQVQDSAPGSEITDLENVFDITLDIKSPMRLDTIPGNLDLCIVVDISNTMNQPINGISGTTRYEAVKSALKKLLREYEDRSEAAARLYPGTKRYVSVVAFNTDAKAYWTRGSIIDPNRKEGGAYVLADNIYDKVTNKTNGTDKVVLDKNYSTSSKR